VNDLPRQTLRTHEEESENRLSRVLDAMTAGFYCLGVLSGVSEVGSITPLLLIRENYRRRIQYNAERASLSEPVTQVALDLLRNRTFRNSTAVFEKDIPKCSIWRLFKEFLCCFVVAKRGNIPPVVQAFGTRTNNVIQLHFGESMSAMKTAFPTGYTHNCDMVLHEHSRDYRNSVCLDDIDRFGTTTTSPLVPGRLYHCFKCGTQDYFEIFPLKRVLRHASGIPLCIE